MNVTCCKSRWNQTLWGPMTESTILLLHDSPGEVRVSRYSYPAGDEIEGISKKCVCYVLKGRLAFACGEGTTTIEAGDVFTFPGGNYRIRISESDAVVVWVWELPQGIGNEATAPPARGGSPQ